MQVRKLVSSDLPTEIVTWLNQQTLLGSTGFAGLWGKLGGKSAYWACYDGSGCVAVLPGVEFGRGALARLQAMPDGLYTRVHFIDSSRDQRQILNMILAAIAECGYAKIYVNDYYRQFAEHIGFEVRESSTHLATIDKEEWQPPDKKLQSEIRKAQREEVVVRVFSPETDFPGFVGLMQHTEQRHGRKPKYTAGFYEELAELAGRDSRVHWLICDHEGQLAASHIYLVEGDLALHWQAFFDKTYSHLKPNQAIMFSAVYELRARGVRVLNLGSSPEGAASLSDYKEKWGGESCRYSSLTRKSWLGRLW